MQSFSQKVKNEIAKNIDVNNGLGDLLGCLISIGKISVNGQQRLIVIESDNAELIRKIFQISKIEFPNCEIDIKMRRIKIFADIKNKYTLEINNIDQILKHFTVGEINYIKPNFDLPKIRDAKSPFFYEYLRGFFLGSGSINDPAKKAQYHFEINSVNLKVLVNLQKNLSKNNIIAKISKRKTSYCLYVNKSEMIADLLIMITAITQLFEFEDHRILRDFHKAHNRINNADIANEVKKIKSLDRQISAIKKLKKDGRFINLDKKTRLIANLRITNPDLSLAELSALTDNKISKTNINHHFQKIIKQSEET